MVRKTQTTSFGSVVRESHSSKKFYSSKLFKDFEVPKSIDFKENAIDGADLNRIYCKSSENLDEVPDDSIHLMITSPPYNVGKEYDDDLSLDEYLELLTSVFRQCYKKLVTGGRACINIANIGRKPYIPLHAAPPFVLSTSSRRFCISSLICDVAGNFPYLTYRK